MRHKDKSKPLQTLSPMSIPSVGERLDIVGDAGSGVISVTCLSILKTMEAGQNILFVDILGCEQTAKTVNALCLKSGYDFFYNVHSRFGDTAEKPITIRSAIGQRTLSFISLPLLWGISEKRVQAILKDVIVHANSGQKVVYITAGNLVFDDEQISCIMNPVVLSGALNPKSRPSENYVFLKNSTILPADIFPSVKVYEAYQRSRYMQNSDAIVQDSPYAFEKMDFMGDIKTFSPHIL